MANTITATNRTIEVSKISSDFMMETGLNVESVVFIPGKEGDVVNIIENSKHKVDPVKVQLKSGDGEPRTWYCKQRLQLGFVFASGKFSSKSKVIFNIGVIR